MPHRTRLSPGRLLAIAACLGLGGCGLAGLREVGYGDRCAALMEQSFPGGGDITITGEKAAVDSQAASLTSMRVTVEGIRKDVLAGGFVARNLAATCRFDNGVLTDFHWTTGPFR